MQPSCPSLNSQQYLKIIKRDCHIEQQTILHTVEEWYSTYNYNTPKPMELGIAVGYEQGLANIFT